MRVLIVLFLALSSISIAVAQQNESSSTTPDSAKPAAAKKDKKTPAPSTVMTPEKTTESAKPGEPAKPDPNEATDKEEHYDVTEVPPVVTHHQTTVNGKADRKSTRLNSSHLG